MIPGGYEDTPEGIWCKHCGEALNEPGHLCDRCARAEEAIDKIWADSQESEDDDSDEWDEEDPWEDDDES